MLPARGVPVWRLSAPMRNVSVFICEMLVFRVIKKGCPQPRGSFFEVARPYATCKFCSYSKCKLFRGKQPHIRNPLCCISRKRKSLLSQEKNRKHSFRIGASVRVFVCLLPFGLLVAALVFCSFLRCFGVRRYRQMSTRSRAPNLSYSKGHKNERTKLITLY